MGRDTWATEDEDRWLRNKVLDFHDAQRQRRVRDFHQETLHAFLQAFPSATPGPGAFSRKVGVTSGGGGALAPDMKKAKDVRLPLFIEMSKQ